MLKNIFTKSHFNKWTIWIGIVLFILGCEDPVSNVGLDLIPQNTNQQYIAYKTDLKLTTLLHDRTYSGQNQDMLFGSFRDPFLGQFRAEFATEFKFDSPFDTVPGTNPSTDSIIIYLLFNASEIYGSPEIPQNVKVYELAKRIEDTLNLFSDSYEQAEYNPELLGETTFSPTKNYARIKLSQQFGNRILHYINDSLDNSDKDDILSIKSEMDKFLNEFPGLVFKTDPLNGKGSIMNMLLDGNSFMRIYYNTTEEDSLILNYTFPSRFKLDDTLYYPLKRLNLFYSPDKEHTFSRFQTGELSDSLVVIQGMGQFDVEIEIPGLTDLISDSIALFNTADIILYLNQHDKTRDSIFTPPLYLGISGIDENGELFNLLPDEINYKSLLTVAYQNSKGYYHFSLAGYLNSILKGESSDLPLTNKFRIYVAKDNTLEYGTFNPKRTLIIKEGINKPILNFVYTKVK